MNRSIFWRLFWKEYRLQRALWITMAVLTVLLLLFIAEVTLDRKERLQWIFWLGLGLPGFYFLGCGAMLFAGEKEAGTYEFRRALPVEAKRLLLAKIAFALTSGVAMLRNVSMGLRQLRYEISVAR